MADQNVDSKNDKDPLFYYSNRASVNFSPDDLVITFQCISPSELMHREPIELHTSWPHAKRLVKILTEHIDLYEDLFGEIQVTPSPEKIESLKAEGRIKVTEEDRG